MSNKRKLEKALTVRLSPSVYEKIVSEGHQQDVTACSILRRLVHDAYGDVVVNSQDQTVDVKAYKPRQPPKPEHIRELFRLRESVAELCGALVHNSIRARKTGDTETHKSLEEIIPDVRNRVHDIDRLRRKLEKN